MHYPNMNVKIDHLASGLYQMIKEHPDGACLRLGMFPNQIMECLDKALADVIPDAYIDRETLDEVDGRQIRQDITHDVCCKILELATNEGFCIV